jgi:hypothetical protein
MNIAALRKDLARLAETRYTLHVLAVGNTAEPKNFLSITVRISRSAASIPRPSPSNPRTQTIAIPAGLVGVATDTANGFDPTMIAFQTTSA